MSVSFKIPKSPKRDIFVIDNFQGVDFTNIGADVDPVRSPNAPNMIRHVPGKVRKRMGYEKYIQFSPKANVNFAKGTSSKEISIVFNPSLVGTTQKLYDLTQKIVSEDDNAFTLYLEFDYRSTDAFIVLDTVEVPASEEWEHYSGSKTFQASDSVEWVGIHSDTQQNIDIKNFSLMKAKDSKYKWSPAPVYFKNDTVSNYVYGCHVYKSYEKGGDSVVNVNRVLNTTNSFRTISVTDDWVADQVWSLANDIWRSDTETTKVYIDFDYTLTGSSAVFMSVATYYSTTYKITPTSTAKHMSYTLGCGSYSDKSIKFKCENAGASGSLSIKNLSICYRTDKNYMWSKAPEDTGGTFPIEDVYTDGFRNFSEIDNYSHQTDSQTSAAPYNYCIFVEILNPSYGDIKGFAHLSFDLYAFTTASDLQSINVDVLGGAYSSTPGTRCARITENGNIINKHYEFYVSSGNSNRAVNAIGIQFNFPNTGDRTCDFRISNIKVKKIFPRNVYNKESSDKTYYIYHVGERAYVKGSDGDNIDLIGQSLAKRRSWSKQLDDTMLLLDGSDIYTYKFGQANLAPITSTEAYIPLVTISKSPSGGGTPYESLNMLQPGFYETFYCEARDANTKTFQLSFGSLDATTTKAWVLNSNGNWVAKVEGINYTVNRTTGLVTFSTAPGQSPLTGEDNVKILAYKTVNGYRDRVAKCRFGTLFGVGGSPDRFFISGNPDYPNQDFYSGQFDVSYWPDTGYSKLGTASSEIIGYAIINNYLATFKRDIDKSQNVIIREGDLTKNNATNTSEPAFRIINALQGEGAITPYAFGYMQTEPIYLTKLGVMAITAQDITGEKYGQSRSFYINEKLTQEEHLEDAMATIYKDMYILAVNQRLYILDGLQPVRTDKGEPYATRQYSAFYCTDIPATCIWTDGETLWFGTEDGKICRFYSDVEALSSYNDDGKPISAWWETPDLDGALFYKNKTFRYFAIRMMQALRTSCKLYSRKMSNWTFIKEDRGSGVVFDFENIDFEMFSFSTDTSEKVVHTKLRVKKVDKARFKIENSRLNEPFGLFDLALEYVESGNYKR